MSKSLFGVNAPPVNYWTPGSGYLVDAAKAAEKLPGMVWGELPFKGQYTLVWDGTGKVTVTKGGTLNGHQLTTTGGQLVLATTGDVRNVILTRNGESQILGTFTATAHEAFAPAGIVRLMDWTRTNNSPVRTWADRCKPEDQLWSTDRGAPYEPWLDYAVRTTTDLWLNVPHQADDDYIRQLATLCKTRIGTAPVALYLEDSNETWNHQFQQAKWQAAKFAGAERWHAERTLTIGRIFREVFGLSDKRIRPVLGCGIAHPWQRDEALKFIGDRHGELYGMAIAPYFASWLPAGHERWTAQQYADFALSAAKGMPNGNTAKGVRQYKALCEARGWKLLAYEGGLDFNQGETNVAAKASAQLLPATGEAIEVYLEWARREGIEEFCYFNAISLWNRSGVWGLESLPGQRGPKWQAWARVANRHQRPDGQPQTPTPTPPPPVLDVPAPEGLTLKREHPDRLEWEWRGVTGTTAYNVYRDGAKVETSGNPHHYTDKLPGVYTVTAVRGVVEGPHSNAVTFGQAPPPDPDAEARERRKAEIRAALLLLTDQRATLNDALAKLHEQLALKQREAETLGAELAGLEGR